MFAGSLCDASMGGRCILKGLQAPLWLLEAHSIFLYNHIYVVLQPTCLRATSATENTFPQSLQCFADLSASVRYSLNGWERGMKNILEGRCCKKEI